MTSHCPSHGEVLAPASALHCPLCGLPLLVTADGGHGMRWLDDANPPETFAGMTYEEFAQFADETPPPQSWCGEDVAALRGPVKRPTVT